MQNLTILFFSTIMLTACGSGSYDMESDQIEGMDTTAVGSEIPTTYCCSNHTDATHCGTQEELSELSQKYGCSGFH